MTRKEFSKKYGIDYNIVIAASNRLKEPTKRTKNAQFSENALGMAVCKELNDRIVRIEKGLLPLMEDYDRMHQICWQAAL